MLGGAGAQRWTLLTVFSRGSSLLQAALRYSLGWSVKGAMGCIIQVIQLDLILFKSRILLRRKQKAS